MSHVAIHTQMHLTTSNHNRQTDARLYTVKYCFICMYVAVSAVSIAIHFSI